MSSVSARAEDLPLRPLLFAVGAAATAFSVYCYVKGGGGKKTTADPENKTDHVCDEDTEPALNQPKLSVAEAEEIIAQLKVERSELLNQVMTLSDTVHDLRNQLTEAHLECEDLRNFSNQEREAFSILQKDYHELKKMHNDELQKVSIAEAEQKHQKAVETIAQLEEENSDLLNKVKTLRDTMQDMGEQLIETNMECDELMNKHEHEREAYSILQQEYNELKKTLSHIEELQTVFLSEAEGKHQKAEENIAQLEKEICELTRQLETQRVTVQDMATNTPEPNKECVLLSDRREQEALSFLQTEYDDMKKTLTHKEELLQLSLAEAEEKHQKTIAQLEAEQSALTCQIETMRETVEDIRELLSESHKQCEQLTEECEREREAHSRLQTESDELKKTLMHTETLKDSLAEAEEKHQKAAETVTQLEEEKSDLLKMNTAGHIALTEAEEKHQKDMETIAQLEEEKSNLTKQLETLRITVQDMGNDLFEANLECDNLTDERAQEQEAHRILQSEYQVMREKLKRCEELLVVQVQKAEEKDQKAVQSTDKLEAEKSGLKSHMRDTLRGTVKDIKNMLYKPHKDKSDKSPESKKNTNAETETSMNRSDSSSEST